MSITTRHCLLLQRFTEIGIKAVDCLRYSQQLILQLCIRFSEDAYQTLLHVLRELLLLVEALGHTSAHALLLHHPVSEFAVQLSNCSMQLAQLLIQSRIRLPQDAQQALLNHGLHLVTLDVVVAVELVEKIHHLHVLGPMALIDLLDVLCQCPLEISKLHTMAVMLGVLIVGHILKLTSKPSISRSVFFKLTSYPLLHLIHHVLQAPKALFCE
mmetsp:Transcript_56330/g.103104  ORF Transcript_56330/g.103104 Transcript_56330/m.103104 type:complete len:213 (-) Transcript_56330:71-709(-)